MLNIIDILRLDSNNAQDQQEDCMEATPHRFAELHRPAVQNNMSLWGSVVGSDSTYVCSAQGWTRGRKTLDTVRRISISMARVVIEGLCNRAVVLPQ